MFIKHSFKNILRSWPKSLLFFLLLAALSAILCIGVSLTSAIVGFIRDCNETYTTIAVFEYIGVDYPNENVFDSGIGQCFAGFDFDALADDPAVLNWDRYDTAFGYISGKTANSANPLYKNALVAVVYILSYNERLGAYQYAIVEDLLDPGAESISGYLITDGVKLEGAGIYLVHGTRTSSGTGSIMPFHNPIAESAGVDGSVGNMIADVSTTLGNYEIPSDSVFYQIAATYTTINAGVTVFAANDLDAFLPFQQADISVVGGRSFTAEEYNNGAKVCILPERLCELMNMGVGDKIDLSLAVRPGVVERESYWAGTGFAYEDVYTIVGIFSPNDDYRDTVFIPKSGSADLSANRWSYTLGQARLKNSRADRFSAGIEPVLPPRVRMTVYDQGYAAAVTPLRDVLRIAVIVTVVCSLTALSVLALFGFLFVYRQRGLARIMRRLGAAKSSIRGYFTFGSGSIALISATFGAFISLKLSGSVMEFVRRIIADRADDLRYSNAGLSVSKPIEFAPDIAPGIFALTALALFILAILACLIFASLNIRSTAMNVRSNPRRKAGKAARSCSLSGGARKYAWLSVRRGASRSALPVVLCSFAAALLLQLTSTTEAYKASYRQLALDTDVSGYLTDFRGVWRNGLLVTGTVINDLYNCHMLSEISFSKTFHYSYGLEVPANPSPFSIAAFVGKIIAGSCYVWTNDLSAVQEFYGCSELPVTFIDGYDLSVFSAIPPGDKPVTEMTDSFLLAQPKREPSPAIVSTAFLEDNHLAPGDIITVIISDGTELNYDPADVRIVGSYIKQGVNDNIYVPLSEYHLIRADGNSASRTVLYYDVPASYVYWSDPDPDLLRNLTFGSLSFKIQGAYDIDAFKEYLYRQGYSEVNKARSIRSFVTIEDKTYTAALRAMEQRWWYMQKIFPALYILLELMAALIPLILIRMRKRESALMRVQGAAKSTVFFSLFLEQAALCLPGTLIGAVIWLAVSGKASRLGLTLVLLFALLWLLGAGISAFLLNRGSVRSILKAEE